jgi:hypothetical protein
LADDEVRLKIDGKEMMAGKTKLQPNVALSAGSYLLELEYERLWCCEPAVHSCNASVGQFCVAYFDNHVN